MDNIHLFQAHIGHLLKNNPVVDRKANLSTFQRIILYIHMCVCIVL